MKYVFGKVQHSFEQDKAEVRAEANEVNQQIGPMKPIADI